MFKKLSVLLCLTVCLISIAFPVLAGSSSTSDPFELIPEAKDQNYGTKVEELGQPNRTNNFRNRYNEHGDTYTQSKDLGAQLASGIVTWDTILLLLTQVVKFIANAGLVIGSAMVIYAGYLYVTAVYTGMESNTGKAKEAIRDAVIGIVIIIFSYAIQRVVIQAFLA